MSTNKPTLAVASFSSIAPAVESQILTYPSYVLCKDDWSWAFVDKDGSVRRVKGYQQENILLVDALPTTDIRADVIYVYNETGYMYIGNKFIPVFKNIENNVTSYDQLKDIPVTNKYGDVSAPIMISELESGAYAVSGQYKICEKLETIFVVPHKVTFLVDSDETNKYITHLDAKNIAVYTVNLETQEMMKSEYATKTWVLSQGYATESFVNQAIEDLYNRIASELIVTKMSQLENDMGYLTRDDITGISAEEIAAIFN